MQGIISFSFALVKKSCKMYIEAFGQRFMVIFVIDTVFSLCLITAKAIYDNKLLECYFTRSFYKHILGKMVRVVDMESEDYSFYQGLIYLLEHNVADLGYELTFSTEVSCKDTVSDWNLGALKIQKIHNYFILFFLVNIFLIFWLSMYVRYWISCKLNIYVCCNRCKNLGLQTWGISNQMVVI